MPNPERARFGRFSPFALAALVVALLLGSTGGAVAGALITGKQIKNESVTGADIKNGSLGSVDIQNNGLLGADVRDGSLTGADVANGSLTNADIADETSVWGAMANAQTDDFTASAWTPVVSKTLTTPATGFLAVTGTLYAEDDFDLTGLGSLNYNLRIDGKVIDSRRTLTYRDIGIGATGSITLVVPVVKGAHTVQVVVSESGSGSYLYGGEVSAVFSTTGSATGLAQVPGRPVVGRVNR
ncbi:hypothetical protein G5V59_19930 [Nocardioides sp. W3-2-3]|uniref:hypothetical protein n=1 Tax=Nocardioides convexus TaxID=2712224 RepID=UPI0024181AD2|nr:hypothetical protein [Nocardioides convexus]NHA01336.1 hypothetical protein [Nocardioides convexus]